MKDLNFFEAYIEKTEFKLDGKLAILVISIFSILSLVAYTLCNSLAIKQETRIVQSLKATAENPTALKKVEEIQAKELEVNEFKGFVEKIRYLDETMAKRDIIDERLLMTITSKMPEDSFFTSLSVFNREIQIVGIAKDKLSIAELEKGLEDLEDLEEIFISNISLQDDYYNFTINITLKDVDQNGEEATEEELPSEEPED